MILGSIEQKTIEKYRERLYSGMDSEGMLKEEGNYEEHYIIFGLFCQTKV